MFKLYINNKIAWANDIENKGISALSLSREISKLGTLSMALTPEAPCYDEVELLKTSVEITRFDKTIFKGRVITMNTSLEGLKNIECEGVLGYLNDTVQRPISLDKDYTGKWATPLDVLTYILRQHNELSEVSKHIKLGVVNTKAEQGIPEKWTEYKTSWELTEELINACGGYLLPRYEQDGVYLDYYIEMPKNTVHDVVYGVNLINLELSFNGDDFCTAVLPTGGVDENGNPYTCRTANNDSEFIEDKDLVAEYGRIVKVIEFDGVQEPKNLLDRGKVALSNLIGAQMSIEATAIDSSLIDEKLAPFEVGEYVRILGTKHKFLDSKTMLVKAQDIDLLNPANNSISVGHSAKTLTAFKAKRGKAGASGRGIRRIETYYGLAADGYSAPSEWSDKPVNPTEAAPVIWSYTITHYSDGKEEQSAPRVVGSKGLKGDKGDAGLAPVTVLPTTYSHVFRADSTATIGAEEWSKFAASFHVHQGGTIFAYSSEQKLENAQYRLLLNNEGGVYGATLSEDGVIRFASTATMIEDTATLSIGVTTKDLQGKVLNQVVNISLAKAISGKGAPNEVFQWALLKEGQVPNGDTVWVDVRPPHTGDNVEWERSQIVEEHATVDPNGWGQPRKTLEARFTLLDKTLKGTENRIIATKDSLNFVRTSLENSTGIKLANSGIVLDGNVLADAIAAQQLHISNNGAIYGGGYDAKGVNKDGNTGFYLGSDGTLKAKNADLENLEAASVKNPFFKTLSGTVFEDMKCVPKYRKDVNLDEAIATFRKHCKVNTPYKLNHIVSDTDCPSIMLVERYHTTNLYTADLKKGASSEWKCEVSGHYNLFAKRAEFEETTGGYYEDVIVGWETIKHPAEYEEERYLVKKGGSTLDNQGGVVVTKDQWAVRQKLVKEAWEEQKPIVERQKVHEETHTYYGADVYVQIKRKTEKAFKTVATNGGASLYMAEGDKVRFYADSTGGSSKANNRKASASIRANVLKMFKRDGLFVYNGSVWQKSHVRYHNADWAEALTFGNILKWDIRGSDTDKVDGDWVGVSKKWRFIGLADTRGNIIKHNLTSRMQLEHYKDTKGKDGKPIHGDLEYSYSPLKLYFKNDNWGSGWTITKDNRFIYKSPPKEYGGLDYHRDKIKFNLIDSEPGVFSASIYPIKESKGEYKIGKEGSYFKVYGAVAN